MDTEIYKQFNYCCALNTDTQNDQETALSPNQLP